MDASEETSRGYFILTRHLRADMRESGINVIKLVLFIADLTMGWHSRWVALSYDEILNGRKKANGERMEPGSGISNDPNVRRAVKDALEAGLIEQLYERGQTFYAIHARYWARANLTPTWTLWKRLPHDAQRDPLIDDSPPAINKIAQPLEGNGSAITRIAGGYQDDSSQLSTGEQPVIKGITAPLPNAAPQQVRPDSLNTSQNTSEEDTQGRYVAASATPSPPSISKSEEEEHQDGPQKAAEPPAQPAAPSQATDAPKQNRPTEEEKAEAHRRAVELEEARKQKQAERERLQAAYQGLERACQKLAMDHLHAWKALQAASPGSEERAQLQVRFDALQQELDQTKQEMARIEQEYKKL